MKIQKIIYLIFFICFFQNGYAQHPMYYQINDEDNLPSNEIYRVVQDNFGYIWIGCDAGLYRYDGFNFKLYTNSKQNGRGISFLQLDSKQRIWCKNFYGQIYRVEGDSLKIIKSVQTSNPSFPQFTTDDKCNLWIYNEKGLIKCNEAGDSLSAYNVQLKIKEEISSLFYDNGSIYIFSSLIELKKFNLKSHKIENVLWNKKPSFLSGNFMFTKHHGKLMFLMKTTSLKDCYSVYVIDNNSVNEFYRFNNKDNSHLVYSIYSDSKDLWATTSFGVFKIDSNSTTSKNYMFHNEKISYMLKDREGMYWFSSLHNGLFVVPAINVIQLNSQNSLLKENNISSVKFSTDGKIVIGSYLGNIYEYDKNSGSVKEKFINKSERYASVKKIDVIGRYTLISRGRFCVIDNYTSKQYFPRLSNIRDFEVIKDTVYMVFPEFICKISFDNFFKKECIYKRIYNNGGKAIEYNAKNKLLYVAMGNGTFIYNPITTVWKELKANGNSILSNSLSYSNGIMWMSTVSSGVYGVENENVKYHFDSRNYLTEDNTRIVKALDEMVWLTTDNYLYSINCLNNSFSKYNITQSINPRDINNIELIRDTVYLATNKGFVFFPANMNWKNTTVPNIQFTSVTLDGLFLDIKDGLNLSHYNKNLKFNFSSVSLKSKQKFIYQYRLVGLDSNWTNVSATTPYVLFSQVPPGKFIFELKAINEHGVQSKIIAAPVFVETPFWQRWWFYVLMILVASCIVTLIFMWRIRFIKRRAELHNKVTASQLTALKSQMNPHFLFNILNSLQDLILKHDIKSSNYYLNKFSMMMRKVLDVSGQEEISLTTEIEMLDTYLELEKLRFGNDFNYSINVEAAIDVDNLLLPPMIIQPFIENALKHGLLHKKGEKTILIEFKLQSNVLLCIVIDNGIGRKKSEEIKARHGRSHQSFATKATEKRIELLNSYGTNEFSFEIIDNTVNEKSTGTTVVISIPYIIS